MSSEISRKPAEGYTFRGICCARLSKLEKGDKSNRNVFVTRYEAIANWSILRKMETLVFAAMFLALPLLAYKVVDYTRTVLSVKNSAVDLVKDLIHSKNLAQQYHTTITLRCRTTTGDQASAYEIRDSEKAVEEVILPRGVNVVGSVTFDADGHPTGPASFIVSKNNRNSHVDIDSQGIITNIK
jgi:hypothetical protein